MAFQCAITVQQQDVDVGVRQQFTAAVTADRDQRQASGGIGQEFLPRGTQHFVDQMRARMHQRIGRHARSEEHTSELQSLMRISYAVFCLKKKNNNSNIQNKQYHKQTYITRV